MADLAQSAVVINRAWTEGGVSGKQVSCRNVTLTVTAQGGTTNRILASVLGLTKIEQASNFVSGSNAKIILASPSVDGSMLLLVDPTIVTDASRVPSDLSVTVITGTVKGYL